MQTFDLTPPATEIGSLPELQADYEARILSPIDTVPHEKSRSADRISLCYNGALDEIVAGQAHLEQLAKNHWWLSMRREDGSEVCVWLHARGPITASWEERAPPMTAIKEV